MVQDMDTKGHKCVIGVDGVARAVPLTADEIMQRTTDAASLRVPQDLMRMEFDALRAEIEELKKASR